MWICRKCGEPHQDQFKECWKCVGAEIDGQVMAGEPKLPPALPPKERKLRSLGSILLRVGIGFLVGLVIGLSSLNFINPRTILPDEWIVSTTNKIVLGLIAGAIFGILVGIFIWVVFPYAPMPESNAAKNADERSTNVFD